jgi:DNA ligase D-like protein (predicted 3'-phosphoesterase)
VAGKGDGSALDRYRRMRDPGRTPEPVPPAGPLPAGNDDTFVIQEHHARRLHWDFRLERDGVLVSWAVPRGLPPEPGTNRLAVHTEDHPVEYAAFAGTIPQGEYGGGEVTIWDRGTYTAREWTDRKVSVELAGSRVNGRYVLFNTDERNWMIRRLDPPSDPDWRPIPTGLTPMLGVEQRHLPKPPERYGYEFDWGGTRALAEASGGRLRLTGADGAELRPSHRGINGLGGQLGARPALLDGELATLDGTDLYLVYDVLHLDGRNLLDEPQHRRRERLDALGLSGDHWQTAPWFPDGGAAVLSTARDRGLPGVVAKRKDASYRPGHRSTAWKRIPSR